MTNSVDPDQTLCSVAYDLGLHCLLMPVWPNTSGYYSITSPIIQYILTDNSFFRVNDQLLRVNNNDVSNVDKKFALGAMRSRSGIVNMVNY